MRQFVPTYLVFRLLFAFLLFLSPCAVRPVLADEPLEVVITGVEGDALENVRAALTPPPGLVADGKVNLPWLDLFAADAPEKIREALEPFGFYDSRVETSLRKNGDTEHILLVTVFPGSPVKITELTVRVRGPGAEDETIVKLATGFPLRKGDVLNHAAYEKGKDLLKARAVELGYLDAEFPVHEVRVSRAERSARIALELETGVRYRFGETTFNGAPQYPNRFLGRYLDYEKGEFFSPKKLGQTQINLGSSDRFKGVVVTADRDKALDSTMPVLVELSPLPRRRLRPGIGYGTDTGFRGSLRYKDVNLFLLGHELNAEINVSQRLQGVAVSYTAPGYRDINSSMGLQVNLQREDTSTYTDTLAALEGSWNLGMRRGRLLTFYAKTQWEDYTVGSQHSTAFLVLPGIRFSQRSFDSPIRPTRGYRFSMEARGTHQYLGSSTGLLQGIADGHAILPLPWRFSLIGRAKGGFTLQNEPLKDLPASLRFFAGGDRSVRGYGFESLGPKDSTGKVTGGKNLLTTSIELERALFTSWGVAAFLDAGNAFDSLNRFRLYKGAGLGVRYYTPIGAIQLDLARQIGVEDPAFRVHFNVGFEL
jgi:translocation and assembly module TamA